MMNDKDDLIINLKKKNHILPVMNPNKARNLASTTLGECWKPY